MSRRPSPPPELPGFIYVEPLGAGGFADVFLYEQQMPKRRVAVKVLLADRISSGAAKEFADEANVMAMLSTHPAIVTIYQAGVAGDGRPYLVMEYCPRPNLQIRARKDPFSVAEALRVGIQVAGAVETAHRAGVLHRDIKPANILVTAYNRPALTDFGIASTTGALSEATGMSIPWSPPEFFADPPQSGARSDVFALGATLYTLLAGRSPFERPGERNSGADLIERIERAALPPLARPDSPPSLQQLLERAMAKNPDARFPSAVAFARALQKVQIELTHSVTPIDIVDEHPASEEIEDDDDGLTRVRNVVSIEPDTGFTRPSAATRPSTTGAAKLPPHGPSGPRFDAAPSPAQVSVQTPMPSTEQTVARVVPIAPVDASPVDDQDRTILRAPRTVSPDSPPAAAESPIVEPPATKSRRGLWIALSAAAVVVIAGGIVAANLINSDDEPAPAASQDSVVPKDVVSDAVPRVTELIGTRSDSTITFTWTNPAPEDGDSYLWSIVDLAGDEKATISPTPTVEFAGPAEGQVCVDVWLKRSDGRASDSVRGCLE